MRIPEADELVEQAVALGGRIWRAVEDQHRAATRKLVTTREDQERLEELLESSKPAYPASARRLHYLLKTPFRYRPPKRYGSRFRRPYAPHGVFYGAEHRRTALAELAYHRYRFFAASQGTDLPQLQERLTVFEARYATARGLDLTRGALAESRAVWTDPADYTATQALGERAARAGIAAIRYESVRDPQRDARGRSLGRNVGVLQPETFDPPWPENLQTWHLYLGRHEANAARALARPDERFDFPRSLFEMPGPEVQV